MNLKRFLFLLILIFISFTNIYAYGTEKTVYLDVDFIINNSNSGKKILNNLKMLNNKNLEEFSKIEKNIKDLDKNISRIRNIASEEELKKNIDILKKEIENYNILKEKKLTELKNIKKKETKLFFEKINPLIENYMEQESINIILDIKNVFVARSNYDITNDILNLINSKVN